MYHNRNYFSLLEEEEVDGQIEPCLNKFPALLPGSRLGKGRFMVCDQANVTVRVVKVRLQRMFDLKFILLFHKFLQLNLLAHTIDQSGDLDTFTNKIRDTFSSVEELNLASKVEVIWLESHHTLESFASDV